MDAALAAAIAQSGQVWLSIASPHQVLLQNVFLTNLALNVDAEEIVGYSWLHWLHNLFNQRLAFFIFEVEVGDWLTTLRAHIVRFYPLIDAWEAIVVWAARQRRLTQYFT